MKKNIGVCLLLATAFCACDRSKNSGLIFSNNMESSIGWNGNRVPGNYPIIKLDNALSGEYVCKLDSTNPYSVTFYMKLKDISNKPLKSVRLSAWFMLTADNSEQNLVAEIRDKDEKIIEWLAKDAKEFEPAINQWVNVTNTIDLSLNKRNNPENYIRIYTSNGKPASLFVDDLSIEFE